MKNSSMTCDSEMTSKEPDAVAIIIAPSIVGRALTDTLKSFSIDFLKSKSLLLLIYAYVFENADNRTAIKNMLTRMIQKIPSFQKDNLEILLLSLDGAQIIVKENKHSRKEFDTYMVAKKFKVKTAVIKHQERRQGKEKPDCLKINDRNFQHLKNLSKN